MTSIFTLGKYSSQSVVLVSVNILCEYKYHALPFLINIFVLVSTHFFGDLEMIQS